MLSVIFGLTDFKDGFLHFFFLHFDDILFGRGATFSLSVRPHVRMSVLTTYRSPRKHRRTEGGDGPSLPSLLGYFVRDFSKRLHFYQYSPPPLSLAPLFEFLCTTMLEEPIFSKSKAKKKCIKKSNL